MAKTTIEEFLMIAGAIDRHPVISAAGSNEVMVKLGSVGNELGLVITVATGEQRQAVMSVLDGQQPVAYQIDKHEAPVIVPFH